MRLVLKRRLQTLDGTWELRAQCRTPLARALLIRELTGESIPEGEFKVQQAREIERKARERAEKFNWIRKGPKFENAANSYLVQRKAEVGFPLFVYFVVIVAGLLVR